MAAIRKTRPQVAVLCTSSALKKVWPQVEAVLKLKVPIVSTTEELSYPWFSNRALARKIDAAAKKAKVAVVGTGVNPGFAMDALPLTLTAICERVDSVRVDRVQDARIRRLPFQQKIGSGLTPEEFAEKVKALTVRHVGLTESVAMIADGLGWKLDRITDEIQPKIAEAPVESQFLKVEAGRVCGIVQDGVGYAKGKPVITLHMEAYLGAPETYDSVQIEGSPNLHVKAIGGLPRRRGHPLDRREHDPEGARRAAGPPHDAEPGPAVLRRREVRAPLASGGHRAWPGSTTSGTGRS